MGRLVFSVQTEAPKKLGKYLRSECGISAGLLRRLKNSDNGIMLNDVHARSVDTVKPGDTITLEYSECSELEKNPGLCAPIVFENECLAVFDKPAGMPVHPSAKHRNDTLGNLFAALYPDTVFRPVNRLDKDTSGLCLVAKDPRAANILQYSCHKIYYAAVHGITEDSGTVDAPIARERDSIITRCVRADGRNAVTHFTKISGNDKYSLLRIRLETGRTHQIRVHMSHIGHPLAGDDLYGGSLADIGRQALHCGEMTFLCPLTNENITVHSEIPEDIKILIRNAECPRGQVRVEVSPKHK